MSRSRTNRPHLCPCKETCQPIYNALAFDDRVQTGDLNEGYSGDCIGRSEPLEYTIGGQKHINDLNHCIFTPLKGIIRFQVNKDDLHLMSNMCRAVLAKVDPIECEECGGSSWGALHLHGGESSSVLQVRGTLGTVAADSR